ncbi:amino acid transporter [Rhizobium sp. CG5]|uniref:LysE/ArgO family amino acid transporter n=1 Tax=Rhizobium sp. CG5 TaxID=2726076 RepID=UPI002033DE50|nr:LysE/ArgO family amino acid transporter [Rhizobium sp. CG5]MCM2471897.1 amino acid transporter [Rhizobium sp. CG5]
MLTATIAGLFLGLSLIVAIGAQNAFVLRQGLKREHVFWVCLVCAGSDAVLIAVGISGFRGTATVLPWLEPVLRYGGATFLTLYGLRSLRAALAGNSGLQPAEMPAQSLASTLATCAALTWLNPHVYLDTVMLLGAISTQYPGREWAFGLGAVCASFLFFFSLGYGARLARPLFARPQSWRLLDGLIAVVMWTIAGRLVWL